MILSYTKADSGTHYTFPVSGIKTKKEYRDEVDRLDDIVDDHYGSVDDTQPLEEVDVNSFGLNHDEDVLLFDEQVIHDRVNVLAGGLYTIIDAMCVDNKQRDSLKKLFRAEVVDMHNYFTNIKFMPRDRVYDRDIANGINEEVMDTYLGSVKE